MSRAFLGAKSAVLALIGIDLGKIVLDGDGFELADLLALAAADAAHGTGFPGLCALVSVGALNNDFVLGRCDPDDVLRTCGRAGSASGAKLSGHNGYAVADLDGSEVAGSGAVAQA